MTTKQSLAFLALRTAIEIRSKALAVTKKKHLKIPQKWRNLITIFDTKSFANDLRVIDSAEKLVQTPLSAKKVDHPLGVVFAICLNCANHKEGVCCALTKMVVLETPEHNSSHNGPRIIYSVRTPDDFYCSSWIGRT